MDYCCEGCFKNHSIIAFIRKNGESLSQCKYCGNIGAKSISLLALRDYLINCIEKAYEYTDESYSNECKYTLKEILIEKEDVFSD